MLGVWWDLNSYCFIVMPVTEFLTFGD